MIGWLGLACSLGGWTSSMSAAQHGTGSHTTAASSPTLARTTHNPMGGYAPVAQEVAPSVVSVFSKRLEKGIDTALLEQLFKDPMLSRFLDSEDLRTERKVTSLGSGVIVSPDGYILTNNHVIDGAAQIQVALVGQEHHRFIARVVGRDDLTDLAVLKIQTNGLPAVNFGNSDVLKAGNIVLAVGNPFDLGQTVTMGIVSAVKRVGLDHDGYESFIQTDAAINPGNSGGPLVDTQGRLMGINTAILSGSGGNQGIGFAIPSNLAHRIMEQLIKHGKVVRGYLGIGVQNLTPRLAKALNVPPSTTGALVSEVAANQAGARAGLETGDIIEAMGDHRVANSVALRQLIAETAPHSRVRLQILRQGSKQTLSATLEQRPVPKPLVANAHTASLPHQRQALSGLALTDLDPEIRAHLHLPKNLKGALIVRIDPRSAAYDAGLRVGDVIQEIDHQPVADASQAAKVIRGFSKKEALVLTWSMGRSHFVAVDAS